MGVEFELKYRASEKIQKTVIERSQGPWLMIAMETTYYDTPDGALEKLHYTLRRRLENGVSVCTVKTPIQGYGRGEWECRCEDITEGIGALCKLGAPRELLVLTGPGVVPVCGAAFSRLAGLVEFEGAVLELALDDGVLMGGGREIPLREVEVELKSGSPEAAVAFAERLAARFALHREEKSKFRRALALAKGG